MVQSTIQCKYCHKSWKTLPVYFLPYNKFHKIFNRNTVKISYSCMPNMKTIINAHNQKITNPKTIPRENLQLRK